MSALHGTGSLLLAYAIVVAAVVATLIARGGRPGSFLLAPIGAVIGLLAAAVVGGLVLSLIEHRVGHPLPLGVTMPVMLLSLAGGGLAAGIWLSRGIRGDQLKRGTSLVDSPATADDTGRTGGGLRFAGVAVATDDETKHFKVIGTTGTGKSTAIRELISGALERGDRMVIADPDGGYVGRFYRPERGDVILNPFDPRSRRWDLFGEIRSPYDADQLARSLIADGGDADRVWNQYARTFVAALLRQLHALGVTDARELYRMVTIASIDELRLLLAGTAAQPYLEVGNERMFGSTRAVAATALTALEHVGSQAGEPFVVRDWVQEGRGVLFLPYRANQIASLRSLLSTWMRTAIFETMSGSERDHRLWFVIDELDAIGAIDGLKDALARLRKFGGRCVLGLQSIAQVSSTYGHAEAQTIIENCGNTLILRCSASEQGGTARFASRLIGEREIVREQITRSRSGGWFDRRRHSVSSSLLHLVESAVLPSEIEQLPDLVGYLKVASQPTWMKVRLHPHHRDEPAAMTG
jgi:type IV secretory pathway TraG/TraD family ATPase VirD4